MKGHKIKVLRPKCFNWGSPRQDKLYFIPNYKKSINNLDSLKKKKKCVCGGNKRRTVKLREEMKRKSKTNINDNEDVKSGNFLFFTALDHISPT